MDSIEVDIKYLKGENILSYNKLENDDDDIISFSNKLHCLMAFKEDFSS